MDAQGNDVPLAEETLRAIRKEGHLLIYFGSPSWKEEAKTWFAERGMSLGFEEDHYNFDFFVTPRALGSPVTTRQDGQEVINWTGVRTQVRRRKIDI